VSTTNTARRSQLKRNTTNDKTLPANSVPKTKVEGVSTTNTARRSQPKRNTTNDKTLPANSVPKIKVEDHPKNNKSTLSKKNRIDSSISVRRTVFNTNSNSLYKTCRTSRPLFIGTVKFRNDHFGAIMGYGDYVIDDSVISKEYYVDGLRHNLFSVSQFCDSDLEVAFRKHSCFIRDLDGVNLIKGSRGTNLYTIYVEDMMRGLPRLKFKKDHLCSACQLGKNKKATHQPKTINTIMEVLHTLHMDLCGPLRVQSINRKKYILVIVDDYSRFIWVKFLRSKDETLEFVVKLLKQLQVGLNKTVRNVRTDNGTKFVKKDLTAYYESVGITHEKTVPRTPVERCCRITEPHSCGSCLDNADLL
ncbi:retrovirus-related pol polyprotein from transposon TNT 1-94, partial [Tanacetum coccineum]